jgi:hypothetical protein
VDDAPVVDSKYEALWLPLAACQVRCVSLC